MNTETKIGSFVTRYTTAYQDIFTTIYVLQAPDGVILFDTASYDTDIEDHVLPLLKRLRIDLDQIRYLFVSHNHRDHAGGLPRMALAANRAEIVSRSPALKEQYGDRVVVPEDGAYLLDVFRVVTIPGHTPDSMGLLDTRTNTLITGDSFQLYGIFGSGKWGANISLPAEHLAAIEKVRAMQVDSILCAHDYHPYGCRACGREEVDRLLDACKAPLMEIAALLRTHPQLDDEEICTKYHEAAARPTLGQHVVREMRAAMAAGTIV